ncbi:hypothetical protein SUDANB58_02111 [Streptomyces sp. enrichment culture]
MAVAAVPGLLTGVATYRSDRAGEPGQAVPREPPAGGARAGRENGVTRLPPASPNNTYAPATDRADFEEYGTRTPSDVARPAESDPGAVTLCVEGESAHRGGGRAAVAGPGPGRLSSRGPGPCPTPGP